MVMMIVHHRKMENYWKRLGIPSVKPTFLLGHVAPIVTQKVAAAHCFQDLYSSTEHPYYGMFILHIPCLLLRDLDLIQNILVKNFNYFEDRPGGNDHDKMGSNLLFVMKSKTWKAMRSHLARMFSTEKLRNILNGALVVGDTLTNCIKKKSVQGKSLNVCEISTMYTSDVMALCFFGFHSDSLTKGRNSYYLSSELLPKNSIRQALKTFCFLYLPSITNIFKMTFLDAPTEKHLKILYSNILEDGRRGALDQTDFINLLLKLEREEPKIFSDDQIFVQTLQFQLGAFDTTSGTLVFALYELCVNPNVQNTLRQEINTVLTKYKTLSLEAIKEMDYLDMTLSEALRKHPIDPVIDRICTKAFNIPNTNISIEPGTTCIVPVYGLHYDPKYFPNPKEFDPMRFSPENKKNIRNGSYMPFGTGPRGCIGFRFALLVLKVALINIIKDFEVELEHHGACLEYDRREYILVPNNNELYVKFKSVSNKVTSACTNMLPLPKG